MGMNLKNYLLYNKEQLISMFDMISFKNKKD